MNNKIFFFKQKQALGEKFTQFCGSPSFTCQQLQKHLRQVLGDAVWVGRTVPPDFTADARSPPLSLVPPKHNPPRKDLNNKPCWKSHRALVANGLIILQACAMGCFPAPPPLNIWTTTSAQKICSHLDSWGSSDIPSATCMSLPFSILWSFLGHSS